MAMTTTKARDREERFGEIVFGYLQAAERGEPTDRRQLLSQHPEFAAELEQFFGNLEGVGRLATPILALVHPSHAATSAVSDGGTLGDYRLIREVGRGGMGIVYEAEQISLARRVALKVLPFAATMDPRHLQRFKNEALAAASLEHPNIVPVHGVGCERGVHYYAMKFIEGQTLAQLIQSLRDPAVHDPPVSDETTAYPAVNGSAPTAPVAGLSTKPSIRNKTHFRRIAELIAQSAEALEHAHSLGIVHRDVKPGNLLLDSAGKIYISDFGLARFGTDASMTMSGDLIGTLRYMSPEQALARHGLVDHRTDIYSLGATLYELLTLRPAVEGDDKGEILKAVAWEDPTPLRKLDKSIPAELETITLKCLAKNPNERYATAEDVAEDLHRWLSHHAIKAKPPGVRERAVKWIRRHRTFARMSFVILVLAVTGLAISTWLIWKEKEAVRLAKIDVETQRDRAVEAEADTQAYINFLIGDVLAVARPEGLQGGLGVGVTVVQALEAAEANLEKRFAGRPIAEATARNEIGKTWRNLAKYEQAERHLRRAAELRERELGPDHRDTLDSRNSLGALLTQMGHHFEAIALLKETLRMEKEKLGPNHIDTLACMNNLAIAYQAAGQHDFALPLSRETFERQRATLGPDSRNTLASMSNLALAHYRAGQYDQAVALYLETLEKQKSALASDHPDTLGTMTNLAQIYQTAGKFDLALPLFTEALEKQKTKLGANYPETLNTMFHLACLYRDTERLDEEEPLLRAAVSGARLKFGVNHSTTQLYLEGLAQLNWRKGNFKESVSLYEELLRNAQKNQGADHLKSITAAFNLAANYHDAGRLAEAEKLIEEWLPRGRKLGFDDLCQQVAPTAASIYQRSKQPTKAETIYRESASYWKKKAGPDSPQYAEQLALLGMNLLKQQKYADADALLRDCLKIREQKEPDDWRTFNTKSLLGGSLLGQKKYTEAEPLLLDGYEGLKQREEKVPPQGKLRLTEALQRLVDLYDATDRKDKAAEWRKKLTEAKSAKPTETNKD